MSEPAQVAIRVWRGDDACVCLWPLAKIEPPGSFDGADVVLVVQWGARGSPAHDQGEFTRTASAGALVVDRIARTVAWTPEVDDFAGVPRGAATRYELKRIVGGRARTLVWGEVRIGSGLLRDPTRDSSPAGQGYTDLRVAALRSEMLTAIAALASAPDSGLPAFPANPGAGRYALTLVGGVMTWVAVGNAEPDPSPNPSEIPGTLNFSDPSNSGLVVALGA